MWKSGVSVMTSRLRLLVGGTLFAAASVGLVLPLKGTAQEKTVKHDHHASHKDSVVGADMDLPIQVAELRSRVAKLEAALDQVRSSAMPGLPGTDMMHGMAGMQDKGMHGMMGMDMMHGMAGMQDNGMHGMMGMGEMAGMAGGRMQDGMGSNPAMKSGKATADLAALRLMGKLGNGGETPGDMTALDNVQMTSALAGVPGASHLYHIGAMGLYLDHSGHLMLTGEQQAALNRLREKALLEKESTKRKIDEAEQELWLLTGADAPDMAAVQEKVRAIEKLRGEQRLAFIRNVSEAAKALTDEQRRVLLGQVPSGTAVSPSGTSK